MHPCGVEEEIWELNSFISNFLLNPTFQHFKNIEGCYVNWIVYFLSADVRFHFWEITESFPTHSFTSQFPKQLCCHLLSWHLCIFDLCLKRFICSCLNGDAEQREGEWAYSTWHHIGRCNLPLFTLKSKWILTNNYCTDGPWCLPGPYTGS